MPRVVTPQYSIQYDGTNGEHIAGAWCTGITFVSDTGTVLTYKDGDGYDRQVALNDWLVIWGQAAGDPWTLTTAQYQARYYELPE